MISEVETNKYRKFELKIGNVVYYIIVEYDDDNMSEFYITKEHSSIIDFQIGFTCPYEEVYDYIKDNVVDWICSYENTLNEMEGEY